MRIRDERGKRADRPHATGRYATSGRFSSLACARGTTALDPTCCQGSSLGPKLSFRMRG